MMREATKADLPRGRQAQCPVCWRMFGSDSTAERHKSYRRPVTPSCKEPSSVGLEARDRGGVAVWVHPMPENVLELRQCGNGGIVGSRTLP